MAGYGFASNPPYGLRRLRAFPDYPTGKSLRLFAGLHSTLHGVVFAILSRPCRAPPKGRYAGSGTRRRKDVDGRDRPGHDDVWGGSSPPSHIVKWLRSEQRKLASRMGASRFAPKGEAVPIGSARVVCRPQARWRPAANRMPQAGGETTKRP